MQNIPARVICNDLWLINNSNTSKFCFQTSWFGNGTDSSGKIYNNAVSKYE